MWYEYMFMPIRDMFDYFVNVPAGGGSMVINTSPDRQIIFKIDVAPYRIPRHAAVPFCFISESVDTEVG